MSLQDIVNYRKISDPAASSGQPEEMQFKDIAEAGFEVVINLAMPNYKEPVGACNILWNPAVNEVRQFFQMALRDEAASVKARIRNIVKQGFSIDD